MTTEFQRIGDGASIVRADRDPPRKDEQRPDRRQPPKQPARKAGVLSEGAADLDQAAKIGRLIDVRV